MHLIIELHDNERVRYKNFTFEFDEGTTLRQLEAAISSTFYIAEKYQEIFSSDGTQMVDVFPNDTLLQIGMQDRGKIIVKHASLATWDVLLEKYNLFKGTNIESLKKNLFESSRKLIEKLVESNFFLLYPKLDPINDKLNKQMLTYYDRTRGSIERSARSFFNRLHHGADPSINFCSKSDGSRRGCLCLVEVQGQTTKYYIKTHHGGGARDTRDTHTREDLDLKELFAYKILEELGVGAEIKFVPNEMGSRWIVYIASKEIIGFRTLNEVESVEDDDNLKKYSTAVVQMLFLYTVMNMADHHLCNMGVDEKGSPFIIDFFLFGRRDSLDVKNDFYQKVRGAEKISNILGTFEQNIEIAKEYILKSNFIKKVDEVFHRFPDENKTIFDHQKLYFKNEDKTEDLRCYQEQMKENAMKFVAFEL